MALLGSDYEISEITGGIPVAVSLKEFLEVWEKKVPNVIDPESIKPEFASRMLVGSMMVSGSNGGSIGGNCGISHLSYFRITETVVSSWAMFMNGVRFRSKAENEWLGEKSRPLIEVYLDKSYCPVMFKDMLTEEQLATVVIKTITFLTKNDKRSMYFISDNINLDEQGTTLKTSKLVEILKRSGFGTVFDFPFSMINPNHNTPEDLTIIKAWMWAPPDAKDLIIPETPNEFKDIAHELVNVRGFKQTELSLTEQYFARAFKKIDPYKLSNKTLDEQLKENNLHRTPDKVTPKPKLADKVHRVYNNDILAQGYRAYGIGGGIVKDVYINGKKA